jgi:hypothetical protein
MFKKLQCFGVKKRERLKSNMWLLVPPVLKMCNRVKKWELKLLYEDFDVKTYVDETFDKEIIDNEINNFINEYDGKFKFGRYEFFFKNFLLQKLYKKMKGNDVSKLDELKRTFIENFDPVMEKEIMLREEYSNNISKMNIDDDENSPFSANNFNVFVQGDNITGYKMPYFQVQSYIEKFHIKLSILDGKLIDIINYGNRRKKDRFTDIEERAQKWLSLKSEDNSNWTNQKECIEAWYGNNISFSKDW